MIRRVRVGVRQAPPDEIVRHLVALGLAPDPEGPIVVRFTSEDAEIAAVVFEDDGAALPWRPLARRLAAAGRAPVLAVRVEAEAWWASDEVWTSGRTTAEISAADGSRTTTEHAVDPFGPERDDAAWDEPADAADWLADTLLTTHFGPHGRPETLTRYRQVTHPDPWLDATRRAGVDTTWADIPVDGSCTAYLAWRLGDRLDVTVAAPDLSAWTNRLLRRYGSATAPRFQAD